MGEWYEVETWRGGKWLVVAWPIGACPRYETLARAREEWADELLARGLWRIIHVTPRGRVVVDG